MLDRFNNEYNLLLEKEFSSTSTQVLRSLDPALDIVLGGVTFAEQSNFREYCTYSLDHTSPSDAFEPAKIDERFMDVIEFWKKVLQRRRK